jgi:GT2 family glycosyltransferase
VSTIAVVVVSFESGLVLERCLASLAAGASRRGFEVWVVDNASRDESVAIASRHVPADRLLRLPRNRGFAAGVNAALARIGGPWIAVLNPDTVVLPGALDRLVDLLEASPRAGLIAPRVVRPCGGHERSVGRFPTPRRERNHAMRLDWIGAQGRTCRFPARTAPVDWASACAWLLRGDAVRDVGPLDEGFFMYFDDVDYCARLSAAGWQVMATPDAQVVHAGARGSRETPALPAEGGRAPLRYFAKHLSDADRRRAQRWLLRGWRLRALAHGVWGSLGHEVSSLAAARFRLALDEVGA